MAIFDSGIFDSNVFDAESIGLGSTFESSLVSQSTITSSLLVGSLFQSTLSNVSTTTANLQVGSLLNINLVNQSEISGTLVKPASTFVSGLASESFTEADLIVISGFAAELVSISSVSSGLVVPIYLASSLSNTSDITANIIAPAGFQALLASESTMSGNVVVPVILQSNVVSNSTLNGNLVAAAHLYADIFNESGVLADLVEGKFPELFELTLINNSELFAELTVPKLINTLFESSSAITAKLYASSLITPGWDSPFELFSEDADIKEMSLTFDQLGRPIVFYRINQSDLYIYWYNAATLQNEKRYIGSGIFPVAGFDIVDETSDPNSDAMLFYVRDNTAYMRIQRESYDIEHNTGITKPNLKLRSSGTRIDNRFQVVYTYSGVPDTVVTPQIPEGTTPVSPEPPIEPDDPGVPGNLTPIAGSYTYKNRGMYSNSIMVTDTILLNGNDSFKLGFEIFEYGSGRKEGNIQYFYVCGADSVVDYGRNLYVMVGISEELKFVRFLVWRGSNAVNYNLDVAGLTSLKGQWELEFIGTRINVYLNGEFKATDWFSNAGSYAGLGRLHFGGTRTVSKQNNKATGSVDGGAWSFEGTLKNCWIDHPNYGLVSWPINQYNLPTQSSNPPSPHTLTLYNHRTSNWVFAPE